MERCQAPIYWAQRLQNPAQQGFSNFGSRIAPSIRSVHPFIRAHRPRRFCGDCLPNGSRRVHHPVRYPGVL